MAIRSLVSCAGLMGWGFVRVTRLSAGLSIGGSSNLEMFSLGIRDVLNFSQAL